MNKIKQLLLLSVWLLLSLCLPVYGEDINQDRVHITKVISPIEYLIEGRLGKAPVQIRCILNKLTIDGISEENLKQGVIFVEKTFSRDVPIEVSRTTPITQDSQGRYVIDLNYIEVVTTDANDEFEVLLTSTPFKDLLIKKGFARVVRETEKPNP